VYLVENFSHGDSGSKIGSCSIKEYSFSRAMAYPLSSENPPAEPSPTTQHDPVAQNQKGPHKRLCPIMSGGSRLTGGETEELGAIRRRTQGDWGKDSA